jgi:hypothetical protein
LAEEGTYFNNGRTGVAVNSVGSEVGSFNSRVNRKVIGNGNGNASTARAKFVHNVVRTQVQPAPFPIPEI